MVAMDMKVKFFKSGKFHLTPELIDRILKSRSMVFHFLTCVWHTMLNYRVVAGALYILFNRVDLVNKTCGFGIQYVTIWNLVIEQNYFNAYLLLEILEKISDPKYDRIKSFLKTTLPYVFTSILFPLSFLVTINFWPIYSHSPQIIDEDKVTESFFPPWVNHGLHTTNFILVFLELFMVRIHYPSTLMGYLGVFSVVTAYCVTCTILFFIGGVWPYPMIGMMNVWQRLLYVYGNCVLGFFIWTVGKNLNDKIWGEKSKAVVKDVKKCT